MSDILQFPRHLPTPNGPEEINTHKVMANAKAYILIALDHEDQIQTFTTFAREDDFLNALDKGEEAMQGKFNDGNDS